MAPLIIAASVVIGVLAGIWFSRRYKRANEDYDPDTRVRFLQPFPVGVAALTVGVVGTLVTSITAVLPSDIAAGLNIGVFGFSITIISIALLERQARQSSDSEEYTYV